MCEDSAFVLFHRDGQRHLDDVDRILVEKDRVRLVDMRGEEMTIPGRLKLIDLVSRRIEIE